MSEESEQQDSPEIIYTRGRLDTGDHVIEAKKITYPFNKADTLDSSNTRNLISK